MKLHHPQQATMTAFCKYLIRKGRITESQFTRAKSKTETTNLKTGLCAYAFGFMEEHQIRNVLDIQDRTRQRFGTIAVTLGYLTQGQLRSILRIQRKHRVTVEDMLVRQGALTEAALIEERQLFQAETGLSSTDNLAIDDA
jgi:hypothetical protein